MMPYPEPLPPYVSEILVNRNDVRTLPRVRSMRWPGSEAHLTLLQRLCRLLATTVLPSWSAIAYLPDTPAGSFYRLYQFLVVGWTIEFRDELEYFWGRAEWPLAELPDPGPTPPPPPPAAVTDVDESTGTYNPHPEAMVRKAVMAGLTRIMARAYNRLISKGLPRDAPALVDDWEELRARPQVLEVIPKWAEDMMAVEPVRAIPDAQGKMLGEGEEEEASEDFLKYGIWMKAPHWVFV